MQGITPVDAALVGMSGLCWTLVYILTIKRDFADETYGMPLVALAINIAWEFRFSLIFGASGDFPLIAQVVNTVWLAFDVVIVYTVFRFGYDAFERDHASAAAPGRRLGRATFLGEFCLALAFCFAFVFVAVDFFIDLPAFGHSVADVAKFIAYAQNLLMSALFLAMYWHRGTIGGQSFWIAFFKWLGTFAVMFEYLPKHPQPMLWLMLGTITVLDLWYMALMWRGCKQEGVNPLRRW